MSVQRRNSGRSGRASGDNSSTANGVNASGQVVGWSVGSAYVNHAFLYSYGTMSDLGVPPGGSLSDALAINSQGDVAGFVTTASSGNQYAFLLSYGAPTMET